MTDTDTIEKLKEALKTATVPRPARQWRNRWKALELKHEGTLPGEEYWGTDVYPSKDIAEENASKGLAEFVARYKRVTDEHVGALPVEGT